jgi:hypothetical protein
MPSASKSLLLPGHDKLLLELARRSIEHGLSAGRALPIVATEFPTRLQQLGAAFVSLHRQGNLRGCIGNLDAHQPLVNEVAENAFNAAFRDPRFPRLKYTELDCLDIEISVLTPREPVDLTTEAELIEKLQPHRDGLVLEEGGYRSTFLPAVWAQLADPEQFLQQLKLKAGLPADYWSPTLRVYRYETISLKEQ